MLTRTYDLILWSHNHTSQFPRNHPFVLGERIEREVYGLRKTRIAAKYTKIRQRLLKDANRALEVLRSSMPRRRSRPRSSGSLAGRTTHPKSVAR